MTLYVEQCAQRALAGELGVPTPRVHIRPPQMIEHLVGEVRRHGYNDFSEAVRSVLVDGFRHRYGDDWTVSAGREGV
jgi:hypothetical protein